jgi:hypothetical protein
MKHFFRIGPALHVHIRTTLLNEKYVLIHKIQNNLTEENFTAKKSLL